MNVCPNCSHENRVGVLLCDQCGAGIFDTLFSHTRQVSAEETGYPTGPLDTRYLVNDTSVIIRVADAPSPIRFAPGEPKVLGRVNNKNPRRPDIDLTVYRAFEKGVSCRHATIRRQDQQLVIADLGSTNGTFVNGRRLPPHEPCALYDGDEIRLGNLFLKIYFQIPSPV